MLVGVENREGRREMPGDGGKKKGEGGVLARRRDGRRRTAGQLFLCGAVVAVQTETTTSVFLPRPPIPPDPTILPKNIHLLVRIKSPSAP